MLPDFCYQHRGFDQKGQARMEKLFSSPSNRLIEKRKERKTNRPNSLIANREVEQTLMINRDVIDPIWERRHAKYVYVFGASKYEGLAIVARKYGRNPRAYMGFLINKDMKNEQTG